MTLEALVIFAKAPVPGTVKTRLSPPLTSEESCSLYEAFVEDLVECFSASFGYRVYLACHPSTEHPFLKFLSETYSVLGMNQDGKDLGTRMERVFRSLFLEGFKRVCIIGTDSPTLPPSLVSEAMQKLKDHDSVLGPTQDGGYYLIGLSRKIPGVFKNIPWGTDQVLTRTREKILKDKASLFLLPFWYDVDHFGDLTFLNQHLSALGKKGRRIPKRTQAFLMDHPELLQTTWEQR